MGKGLSRRTFLRFLSRVVEFDFAAGFQGQSSVWEAGTSPVIANGRSSHSREGTGFSNSDGGHREVVGLGSEKRTEEHIWMAIITGV